MMVLFFLAILSLSDRLGRQLVCRILLCSRAEFVGDQSLSDVSVFCVAHIDFDKHCGPSAAFDFGIGDQVG
jgi:hypothetical protein